MTKEEYAAAARYWDEKDAGSVRLERDKLRAMAEEYIRANNTCALATGAGSYVRCTPIEYSYHDGCFWLFSEGGKKFIGLADNPNVSLAIFDKYEGFGKLHGMRHHCVRAYLTKADVPSFSSAAIAAPQKA